MIEAHWLFGFGADEIDILVHPESVVHSMIEMVDGSVIAQMGVTDMRHAIQYALTYPERHECQLPPLDLTAVSGLHFEAPDPDRFPCIGLAYRALSEGGTLPAAMNAANEEAVEAFLNERICLTEIPHVIEIRHERAFKSTCERYRDDSQSRPRRPPRRPPGVSAIEKLAESSSSNLCNQHKMHTNCVDAYPNSCAHNSVVQPDSVSSSLNRGRF